MSAAADAKANKPNNQHAEDATDRPFVDFNAISSSALHSYISYFDLAHSYPPPDTTLASSSSSSSASSRKVTRAAAAPTRNPSPAPTAAASASRKRTADAAALDHPSTSTSTAAAAAEDDPPCPSHFFDADAASLYLSQVAAKHFASQPAPKEGEVVVGFLYKCKAKGELNRPLAHHRKDGKGARAGAVAAAGQARSRATATAPTLAR